MEQPMADFMRSCESHDLHSELPRHGDPSCLSVHKTCDLELHAAIAKPPKSCMKFKLDAQKPGSKVRFKQLEWADVLRKHTFAPAPHVSQEPDSCVLNAVSVHEPQYVGSIVATLPVFTRTAGTVRVLMWGRLRR